MFGFFVVFASSIFFCFQNVIVRILFNQQILFGVLPTGGFVAPTLQNSFLLMFMRMLLAFPLMALVAPRIYPETWQEIWQLRAPEQREVLWRSLGSGLLMFLYLALLYVSIGMISTGIALTLFFSYPIFTGLFSWRWFGARPSLFQAGVMALVLLGSYLTLPQGNSGSNTELGTLAGIASGITYALYTVMAQKSFERIHPVPFTGISFATTLVLSMLLLMLWPIDATQLDWIPLWIGGFLSALVTFSGHLIYNYGIRLIGATSASMIGSSNPVLTTILAWLTIQEALSGVQLFGIGIVTFSVALLSQKHRLTSKVPKDPKIQ